MQPNDADKVVVLSRGESYELPAKFLGKRFTSAGIEARNSGDEPWHGWYWLTEEERQKQGLLYRGPHTTKQYAHPEDALEALMRIENAVTYPRREA
jgi:hypothetical protein